MSKVATRSFTSQARGRGSRRVKYKESNVRRWLHNLASGMQSAGQSTLLMEQLQPGMLPRRREKIVYIFITRCLAGLLVGAAGGSLQHGLYVGSGSMEPGSAVAWGFAAGFATAVAATAQLGKRILKRFPITSHLGLEIFVSF